MKKEQIKSIEEIKGKTVTDVFFTCGEQNRLIFVFDSEFAMFEGGGSDEYPETDVELSDADFASEPFSMSYHDENKTKIKLGLRTEAKLAVFKADKEREIELYRQKQIEQSRTLKEKYPNLVAQGII